MAARGGHMTEIPPDRIKLHLEVTDPEVVKELSRFDEGPDRDDYAVSAIRLGVLALRQARGEIDAGAIRREGERLVSEVKQELQAHASEVTGEIASALRQYLDPSTGALPQRLERLIKTEGELDSVLMRHLGGNGSLGPTLGGHVRERRPLVP